MSSSITTKIPIDPIPRWCLGPIQFGNGERWECANDTLGTSKEDFQTFCCNGRIINAARDLRSIAGSRDRAMNLSDLVCCGLTGPQAGGLRPAPAQNTRCSDGSPTPLAQLAGTNTDNAAPFLVTYTSASYGDRTVGDYVPTQVAQCLWALTSGLALEDITLPAPDITTLTPATTDRFGFPIPTRSTTTTGRTSSTATESGASESLSGQSAPSTTSPPADAATTEPESGNAPTSTPSAAVSGHTNARRGLLYVFVGLAALSLLYL
ncbi:hypothetical protein GGS23DRAFT_619367 [Durotheca rogersii]|uniref:uncharacterized protein n=1 Tax=Durotheca rogersii TaxID=419775 RepID=UPI00221F16CC|nr:uncharacterized protein GGS23DRAFT_619367 [Durotheca rogersii]KAI5864731.1 hypothetical protein GGS23DRAFT_619367 [Durotheca rogersii]